MYFRGRGEKLCVINQLDADRAKKMLQSSLGGRVPLLTMHLIRHEERGSRRVYSVGGPFSVDTPEEFPEDERIGSLKRNELPGMDVYVDGREARL